MYKFCFFVPVENADEVKSAVFLTGAGRIGNYECCSWETEGTGQFKPLSGSQPYLGQEGKVEKVKELKIEMVCSKEVVSAAVEAMKAAHPYEEPAYEVFRMESL